MFHMLPPANDNNGGPEIGVTTRSPISTNQEEADDMPAQAAVNQLIQAIVTFAP